MGLSYNNMMSVVVASDTRILILKVGFFHNYVTFLDFIRNPKFQTMYIFL